jgi:hypothetical protein
LTGPTEDIQRFAVAARAFFAWFEDGPASDVRRLHAVLAQLQAAAAELVPLPFVDGPDLPPVRGRTLEQAQAHLTGLPFDGYRAVFDPLDDRRVEESVVASSLVDDLNDIYADLVDGLRLFDQGRLNEAVREWRFGYYAHWGRHLAHAQSAIWTHLADGESNDA